MRLMKAVEVFIVAACVGCLAYSGTIPRKVGNKNVAIQNFVSDSCQSITKYQSGRALGEKDEGILCWQTNGILYVWDGSAWVNVGSSGGGGGGSPGGTDEQVQFNDNGIFAGASGILWHKDTSTAELSGTFLIPHKSDPASCTSGELWYRGGDPQDAFRACDPNGAIYTLSSVAVDEDTASPNLHDHATTLAFTDGLSVVMWGDRAEVRTDLSENNLGQLGNVDTSGAGSGDVLKFDGTLWKPGADTGDDLSDNVLSDLSDVSGTSPTTGQVLKWDGSEWAPAADNEGSGGSSSDYAVALDIDKDGTNPYAQLDQTADAIKLDYDEDGNQDVVIESGPGGRPEVRGFPDLQLSPDSGSLYLGGSLTSCTALETDSAGKILCGTDDTGSDSDDDLSDNILNDIGDVSVDGAADGQCLKRSGSNWIAGDCGSGGGSGSDWALGLDSDQDGTNPYAKRDGANDEIVFDPAQDGDADLKIKEGTGADGEIKADGKLTLESTGLVFGGYGDCDLKTDTSGNVTCGVDAGAGPAPSVDFDGDGAINIDGNSTSYIGLDVDDDGGYEYSFGDTTCSEHNVLAVDHGGTIHCDTMATHANSSLNVEDLADVSDSSPGASENGYVLTWDWDSGTSTGEWKPMASSGGGGGGGPTVDHSMWIGDGSSTLTVDIPRCDASTQKLIYNSDHTWSCETDATGGGGGGGGPTTDDRMWIGDGSAAQEVEIKGCTAATQKLIYHQDTNSWTCETDATGSDSDDDLTDNVLSDLSDVSSTSPANGQVLKWNGTAWGPGDDQTGSGAESAKKIDADEDGTAEVYVSGTNIRMNPDSDGDGTNADYDYQFGPTSCTTNDILSTSASSTVIGCEDPGALADRAIDMHDLHDVQDSLSPSDGQVLKWSASAGEWQAAEDSTGGGGPSLAVGQAVMVADEEFVRLYVTGSSEPYYIGSPAEWKVDYQNCSGCGTGAKPERYDTGANLDTVKLTLCGTDGDDTPDSTGVAFVMVSDNGDGTYRDDLFTFNNMYEQDFSITMRVSHIAGYYAIGYSSHLTNTDAGSLGSTYAVIESNSGGHWHGHVFFYGMDPDGDGTASACDVDLNTTPNTLDHTYRISISRDDNEVRFYIDEALKGTCSTAGTGWGGSALEAGFEWRTDDEESSSASVRVDAVSIRRRTILGGRDN